MIGVIRAALESLQLDWDEMLEPREGGAQAPITGSREAPTPLPIDVLSLRVEVERYLVDLVTVVAHERKLRGPVPAGDLPVGALQMIAWLQPHAPFMEAHAGADLVESRLVGYAAQARAIARPERADSKPIGTCPRQLEESDAVCGRSLRWTPGVTHLTCPGCGHQDDWAGWEQLIVGHRPEVMTAIETAAMLARKFPRYRSASRQTVYSMERRGCISRQGLNDAGEAVFNSTEVLVYASRGIDAA